MTTTPDRALATPAATGDRREQDELKRHIVATLERARARTHALTATVDDDDLVRQHSTLMSPLVWDLAHIGNQEELWLLRDVGGKEPILPETVDQLYDAFQHPRADRPSLPLLDPVESRRYVVQVRERVIDLIDRTPLQGRRLTENGFVFGMIAQHEQQHGETMLATHQLRKGDPVLDAPAPPRPSAPVDEDEVLIPGGSFRMGTSTHPWSLDNERPAHGIAVNPFWMDTHPVSNGRYQQFLSAGGYDDPRWWSPAGWRHRQESNLFAPLFWRRDGDGWLRRRFGRVEPVPVDEPVMHVSFHEAEAFARWAGRRLPTEPEWEYAARHDHRTGRERAFPWGDDEPTADHANLGQAHLQPAPVGAYPAGATPDGVHQLVGDVWEWTSSDFGPYPGFVAWPYQEYSEVFFGPEYKVLRGGSFASDEVACRTTFRNWDYPIRRQIFAGFRTARDAHPDEARVADPDRG